MLSINSQTFIHNYMAYNILVGGPMVNYLGVGHLFGGWLWFGALKFMSHLMRWYTKHLNDRKDL